MLVVVGEADPPTIRACEGVSAIGAVKFPEGLCVVGDNLGVGNIER